VTTRTEQTELVTGDVLLLYTDGLTDLPPPFGIDPEQLADLVHEHRSRSADDIALVLRTSLEDRVPDRNRRDDAALLVAVIR
jgi:serine phosphatase RsbU (regulator of sigma subunit)